MKICIVSLGIVPYYRRDNSAPYGGAETQAAFVADAVAAAGNEVSLVVANLEPGRDLPHPAENAFHSERGIPVLRFVHPRWTGIVNALERADADLYYQRNAGMVTGVTGLFCRRRGKAFVYGTGSDTDLTFSTARVDGIRDRSLFYLGLKMTSGIVAQNQRQEQLCRQHLGKPVKVIPNGVHVRGAGAAGARDRLAWIGAIRRAKRPELFIDLARRMPSRQFVLIGGKSATEPGFAGRIAESAASVPNLRWVGHVAPDEVHKWLERSVLLVNTSRVEGFPNAYLEAWSHGVPVVALADVDDIITGEDVGVVCGSIAEIEAAIGSITASASDLAAMGARARALVDKRFSAEVLGRAYAAFFERIVSGEDP
ncbi:MAG: glycosyltransferase family 4 protein [Candidatus Krumholzibacteriia bacterium]